MIDKKLKYEIKLGKDVKFFNLNDDIIPGEDYITGTIMHMFGTGENILAIWERETGKFIKFVNNEANDRIPSKHIRQMDLVERKL